MLQASQREEETCMKHVSDCIFFIWDHALFYGCVCIVHMNNSANVTCIVCNCTSITLANSLNNVSTSRSSSYRSPPPKQSDITP